METTNEGLQALMDEFMSEDGLDLGDEEPYHLKINNKTGFFQIEEFSNNRSELIAPNLTIKPTADMVFKQKSLYKVLSDKYPKTDTVPSVVTHYFLKRDHVGFGKDGQDWLTKFMDKPMSLSLVMQPPQENVQRSIYHIDNKQYVFTLTPTGKKLLADAAIAGDDSIYAESGVTGHPINSQISAYEVFPVNTGASVILYNISDTPARHINGLLQYYAQKKGLLGASRRTTLRKRSLLKSR
jgi:hypothetical protein